MVQPKPWAPEIAWLLMTMSVVLQKMDRDCPSEVHSEVNVFADAGFGMSMLI